MDLTLKGVIDLKLAQKAYEIGFSRVAFDFRPKSFNFTQQYKVTELLRSYNPFHSVQLVFENDKEFVVKALAQNFDFVPSVELEFTGEENFSQLEDLGYPYIWHYREGSSLQSLSKCKNLKRIVLSQNLLENYQENGELFGFSQLLNDYLQGRSDIKIELLTDWDSSVMFSIFEYTTIHAISFEVNQKVEQSYRVLDYQLMEEHMHSIREIFQQEAVE